MRLLRRLALWAVIGVGVGLFVVAGFIADTDPEGASDAASPAVEQLIPSRNAEIVRQGLVGVDLDIAFDATLRINGVEIPRDQLQADNGLRQLLFQPGPGKVIERLNQSQNCAEAVVWRISEGPQAAQPPIKWCFQAV
ncbi:MAG: hypothetical protein ACKVWR_22855 [Acidimicrobiales bacterium]